MTNQAQTILGRKIACRGARQQYLCAAQHALARAEALLVAQQVGERGLVLRNELALGVGQRDNKSGQSAAQHLAGLRLLRTLLRLLLLSHADIHAPMMSWNKTRTQDGPGMLPEYSMQGAITKHAREGIQQLALRQQRSLQRQPQLRAPVRLQLPLHRVSQRKTRQYHDDQAQKPDHGIVNSISRDMANTHLRNTSC